MLAKITITAVSGELCLVRALKWDCISATFLLYLSLVSFVFFSHHFLLSHHHFFIFIFIFLSSHSQN
jgi:hypothetical protein